MADDVTVVVMTRNRREDLLATLPRHDGPVVVVDNASDDGTAEAVRARHPNVTVEALPHNIGAAARTVGARRARTPFVAFADDDSWWEPASLVRGAQVLHQHPTVGLLNARILVGEQERLDPVCREMASSPLGHPAPLPGPRLLGFVGCAAMVRRDAFLDVGGFDDVIRFPGEEERVALDLRAAGWELVYLETLTVHHHPSPRREDPAERRTGILRSRLLTAVMRDPWHRVATELAGAVTRDGAGRRAVVRALPTVPRAVAARRRLPEQVRAERALLTAHPAPWARDARRHQ